MRTMARAGASKAKEPPKQAIQTIKRLTGSLASSRDEQRLYDAHRAVLRAYRALVGSGTEAGKSWKASVDAALRYLGGDSDQHSRSLRFYDHHRYGPFLGVSDDGDSAELIRRAAHYSPKAQALGKGEAEPLTVGVALDAERLGGVGEVPVGPDEFIDIWRECIDRTLLTTNIGGRCHLWLYRLTPRVEIADGDSEATLAEAKEGLAEAFKPFFRTPDGKARQLTAFVEFPLHTERPVEQQRELLTALQQYVQSGKDTAPDVHHLGLCVRIGWDTKGADAAIRAIDLAAATGTGTVGIDGVVRKEADRVGSFPGLLNYLPPADVARVLSHAEQKKIRVRPRRQVDPDTVARSIWSTLNTARNMGLDLGKYGLFPLTMEECDIVVGFIQKWFPDWSAAPVYYVEQAITHGTRVYDGKDRAAGLEAWLKIVARHKVKVVLIDTVDKAAGWKILRTDNDPKGLLDAAEIEQLSKVGEKLGIKVLWAGGITLAQAQLFGKLGVFGLYVTTAAAASIAVTDKYTHDRGLAASKRPTYRGVMDVKTIVEAGFLAERLKKAKPELAEKIARAGLDPGALEKILPAAWQAFWKQKSKA
jgi:hypothetical protein